MIPSQELKLREAKRKSDPLSKYDGLVLVTATGVEGSIDALDEILGAADKSPDQLERDVAVCRTRLTDSETLERDREFHADLQAAGAAEAKCERELRDQIKAKNAELDRLRSKTQRCQSACTSVVVARNRLQSSAPVWIESAIKRLRSRRYPLQQQHSHAAEQLREMRERIDLQHDAKLHPNTTELLARRERTVKELQAKIDHLTAEEQKLHVRKFEPWPSPDDADLARELNPLPELHSTLPDSHVQRGG